MGKIALITGISCQDGSYLAELLIKKKYKVYGICSPYKKVNFENLKNIRKKIVIKKIDINNYSKIKKIIKNLKPAEVYHLAARVLLTTNLKMNF